MAESSIPVVLYSTFWLRLRGLLFRPPPELGTAVWLLPCSRVHSLGMGYTLDVVYLDKQGIVLFAQTLKPQRLGARVPRAFSVLELREGQASTLGLVAGLKPRLIHVKPGATTQSSST